ncbi:MAG: sigma-70 family RNA polymerase sigma factor [Dysgonamonadaceae bacterium]
MRTNKDISYIYNLYVDDLFTYGTYLGFESEVVKDAVHDVFVKITIDSGLLKDVSDIKFYLFKSVKYRLFDLHKKTMREIMIDNTELFEELPFNIELNVEDNLIEEEEQLQVKNEISLMLDSLTSRQREIIYLRYVQEYDYEKIAELLKISVHSCRKLVSKAILSLRDKFGILIKVLVLLS